MLTQVKNGRPEAIVLKTLSFIAYRILFSLKPVTSLSAYGYRAFLIEQD